MHGKYKNKHYFNLYMYLNYINIYQAYIIYIIIFDNICMVLVPEFVKGNNSLINLVNRNMSN